MRTKRRALVLTDESARHPFLRTLPPHVRDGAAAARAIWPRLRLSQQDWRTFFTTYCAAFVVVSIFIA